MSAAPLTPRVRVMVVCSSVRPNRIESDCYDLRGVRFQVVADSFPFAPRRLRLFLVLSSPRKGRFPGYVQVINDQTDKAILIKEIVPTPAFEEDDAFLLVDLPIKIRFPQTGRYTFQVWFFQKTMPDVLKMEQPFYVLESEG